MIPTVSVCIPTYNRATTLGQTIHAVLKQTFQDLELIICDDGSSDHTDDVVDSFHDDRIRYYKNEKNLGLYPNWNRCISLATGKYVAIYHDHDYYLPTIVERSVSLLERYPDASFAHTALLMADENKLPVRVDIRNLPELMPGVVLRQLLSNSWHSPIMAATAMVRREAYQQVGSYNPDLYGLGCDMNMWFRLADIGDIAYVDEPQVLIQMRRKGDQTATFHWSEVVKSLRMRRDHLEQVLGANPRMGSWYSWAKYALQRDRRLFTFMVRALLVESPEVIEEGECVVKSEGSLLAYWGTRLIKRSAILHKILYHVFLPMHYRRVARWSESQNEVTAHYLQTHPFNFSNTAE